MSPPRVGFQRLPGHTLCSFASLSDKPIAESVRLKSSEPVKGVEGFSGQAQSYLCFSRHEKGDVASILWTALTGKDLRDVLG